MAADNRDPTEGGRHAVEDGPDETQDVLDEEKSGVGEAQLDGCPQRVEGQLEACPDVVPVGNHLGQVVGPDADGGDGKGDHWVVEDGLD